MSTIMQLVEELVKAERDLAYAESAFDRIGKRDRQKEVDEARAALVARIGDGEFDGLLEAVDTILETAPCDCSAKRRYERGEHLSHCYLFDLNHARNGCKICGTDGVAATLPLGCERNGGPAKDCKSYPQCGCTDGVGVVDHQTFSQKTPTDSRDG